MKNLLLSSCILFFFIASCTFGHYSRLKETVQPLTYPKSIFGDHFNSFLFKTNIHLYGKEFSGLLITKQMSPQDYRVVFTTELGLKLFDFEFKDSSFTLHYCVPQFNRPKLLKVIQQDFELLLMNNISHQLFINYEDPEGIYYIQKLKDSTMYNYYFTEKISGHLAKIEHSKKRVKKIIFTLNNYDTNFPGNILITHCDIKLIIELNYLKR